jgi:hypothetical protein
MTLPALFIKKKLRSILPTLIRLALYRKYSLLCNQLKLMNLITGTKWPIDKETNTYRVGVLTRVNIKKFLPEVPIDYVYPSRM